MWNCEYDNKTQSKKLGISSDTRMEEDSISYLPRTLHQIIATKIRACSISNKNTDLPQILKLAKDDPSLLELHPFNEMSQTILLSFYLLH